MNDYKKELLKKGKTGAQAMLNHLLANATGGKSLTFKEIDELGSEYIDKIWKQNT